MTPEEKLRQHVTNTLKRTLPKGRYVLQPIETRQIGVPDFYFAFNSHTMWIETKTTDYVVDCFQRNWAAAHQKAGGRTLVLTQLKLPPTSRQPAAEPQLPAPPTCRHNAPANTNAPTPQPAARGASSALYLLPFDGRMLDYSTLGIYIKAERPSMTALEDFLDSLR